MQQIFVRDGEGKVYGPLEPVTVELLIDGGVLKGALLVSPDGVQYGSPARFPTLRDYFPRHLWGEGGEAPPGNGGPAPPTLVPGTPATRTPLATPAVAPAAAPSGTASPTAGTPVVPTIAPIPPPAPARKTPTGSFNMAPPGPRPTPAAGSAAVPTAEPRFAEGSTARPASAPAAAVHPGGMPVPPRTTTPRPPPAPAPSGSSFMVASGDLAEISAIRLYAQAAETSVTGLFTFELADRSILIHFRKGNPEFIDSTHPEDAAELFLSQRGLVTPEQLQAAGKEKRRFGGEVLATLFALGLVNPGLVFPALGQRAVALLLRAFLAPSGIFQYQPIDLPASKVLPLGNRWAFLAEVIRHFPLTELKRRMMDVRTRPLVRRGGGSALPDLRFNAQELRVLSYFDGTQSLAILAQNHAGEMETVLRVAVLLRELDALSFPEIELRGGAAATGEHATVAPPGARPAPEPAPPARPAPPPAAAAQRPPVSAAARPAALTPTPARGFSPPISQTDPTPARGVVAPLMGSTTSTPTPGTPVDYIAEVRSLRTRIDRAKSQNHFQLLGLSEKADAAAVKAVYFKLAKQFHPDTVAPDAPPVVAELKAQVFALVGEASRVLGDDQSRADYLESLAAGGGASVDVRQVLAAEDTFHKGTALIKARRFPEAVKALDDAITLNPREGEFYAWRGYARFFITPDRKVAMVDAMRDLHHALKLNERCAPAHYLIGQLHKLTGDNTLALKHFKKCVNLDGGHVDAQREIRLLTGR